MTAIDLRGQVALVTGGGRGLGRVMALALARAGAAVAVAARSVSELDETVAQIVGAGGAAQAFPLDVTNAVAVRQMVATMQRQWGPVDLLVNNAATLGPGYAVADVDGDAWWRCLEINLRGPFICTQAVLPAMLARRRGRMVNVASGAGLGPGAKMSAYHVSKAALIRFSENLALETKDTGIRVFAIHPGLVRTAMTEHIPQAEPSIRAAFASALAAGRDVPPERAADLLLRLAAGEADALSGCYITVFDDLDALVVQAETIQQNEAYRLRLRTLP